MRTASARRLSLVIPFRDRHQHLESLLPVLERHLSAIPHRIVIVEQADDRPFNKGKMLNVGALLSPSCDYFCFHDVDLVPTWKPTRGAYGRTRGVAHLVGLLELSGSPKPRRPCPNSLGGVVVFDRATFFAVNGFSNEYWGWGKEDDDLYVRVVFSQAPVCHRRLRYRCLPHPAEYRANHPEWAANCARYERMARGRIDHLREGLNSLSYTLVSHRRYPRYEWIRIHA